MAKFPKKHIICVIIITILALPFQVWGQRTGAEGSSVAMQAKIQAEADAARDANTTLWLAGGCLFSIFTVGLAYFLVPNAPYERLMGKSSEYVAAYSMAYKTKRHDLQMKYSLIGCGISGVIFAIAMVVQLVIKE